MFVSATLSNIHRENEVTVATGDVRKKIIIPSKTTGQGSSVNGEELLFLSLATCFCNALYREAARSDIEIHSVEVTVKGEFGKNGESVTNIMYEVKTQSSSSTPEEMTELIQYVDGICPVHNILRKGTSVSLRIQEPQMMISDIKSVQPI